MSSFNKVLLMGHLTRDPQVKQLPGNSVVAEFGLACSRRYRTASGEDREETAFVDCTAFGKQAETLNRFCRKGKPLFVEGRLKYDTWDDKQSGAKRSKLSVVVENFQFVGSRDDSIGPVSAGPGSGGADAFGSESPRQSSPAAGADSTGRKRRVKTSELPFSRKKEFEEADIPF